MQNRFGLKDFFLFALVTLFGVLVILRTTQADRAWELAQKMMAKVGNLEAQLGRVESKIDSGVRLADGQVVLASGGGANLSAGIPETGGGGRAGARDESWARPGVPIQWQPDRSPSTDPRLKSNFREGGEYTEIYEAQTKVLTPSISTDVYSRRMQELVLEALADLDPVTLKRRGLLAEAWQVDPNGLWLRARLRPGVRFSDGVPLTAEDIRWTFHEFLMNEQIDAERDRSVMRDSIKKVTAIDDRTVEFEFFERLFLNVDNALSMFVLPKHILSKLSPAQINQSTGLMFGSGPFKMKDFSVERQWTHPADVVLERNEQYWGVKPPLARLRFQAISEEIARLNAFAKGDADMITPSAPQFDAKKNDPSWKDRAQFLEWVNMRSGYSFIAWNCGERNGKLTPFHDKRVRIAMTHALDREKMIRDIWKGYGVVAKGNMNPDAPGAAKDIQPYPYDLKRAKELFKEAGWEDRDGNGVMEDANGTEFAFEYSYSGGSEIAERIAKFAKDSYQAVGIRVTLRQADWSVYQDYMKKRDFDSITLGWGANGPESDPKQIYHSDSIKNQGDNFAQWNCPEADRLIDEGRREMDFDKRQKIWAQLERVLHAEQPYTYIRVPPWLRFASTRTQNVVPYPKGLQIDEFFIGGGAVSAAPGTN